MKIIRCDDRSFVPAGHENPLTAGCVKKVLFVRDDLRPGRVQMVNWARLLVGQSFSAHYHEDMQEMFIVIRGVAEITVDSETATLYPGDTVLIEPREVHRMHNRGGEDVDYLAIGIAGSAHGRTVVVEAI